jgi:probable DNA repair protein
VADVVMAHRSTAEGDVKAVPRIDAMAADEMQADETQAGEGSGAVMTVDRMAVAQACLRGATVLTPNRRLARALKREFDQAQVDAGKTVWASADVLPWDAWLLRSLQEAECDGQVLSPLQDLVLWRQVIAQSPLGALLLSDAAARSAQQAWQALHGYGLAQRLRELAATEDQRVFRHWAGAYAQRLRALDAVAPAQAASVLQAAVARGPWRPRQELVLAGFDALTPQQHGLLETLRAHGVELQHAMVPAVAGAAQMVACADAAAQWRAAAAWARARLTARPGCRLGIVVPDLGAHRAAITHALAEALVPTLLLAPDDDAARPFDLSLGEPLAEAPLVATALTALQALSVPLALAEVSSLLRSPFLGDAQAEALRRARLDRALRDAGAAELDLLRLRRLAARANDDGAWHGDAAPLLAARLARVVSRRDGWRRAAPSVWAERFFGVLSDLGVPGERTLNSAEYQTHVRLRELLASLATLDRVLGTLALPDAVTLVRRLAADTVFQPESPDVPVQVLGTLEAQHLQFDGLWVAQMTDLHWPPPVTPNPLLPLAWQRAARMPGASVEEVQAQARGALTRWAGAGELVLSYPQQEGDRRLLPSPLLRGIALVDLDALAITPAPTLAQALQTGARLADTQDVGPRVRAELPGAATGGTHLFADQAACAFRSFALHRLRARELREPEVGLNAADRGALLHATMAHLWRELRTHAALLAASDGEVEQRVSEAARNALAAFMQRRPDAVGARAQDLERRRLARTARAWLQIERQRPPFEVITIETPVRVVLGGMALSITPDRIDRLADGSVLIVDYKSRSFSPAAWLGARPDEPQLPLYAVTCEDDVAGVAFAVLAPGKLQFKALVSDGVELPGAKVVALDRAEMQRPGWHGLLADLRAELERLAVAYLAGDAAVTPKRKTSCQFCPLPLLCRLQARRGEAERLDASDAGAEGAHDD